MGASISIFDYTSTTQYMILNVYKIYCLRYLKYKYVIPRNNKLNKLFVTVLSHKTEHIEHAITFDEILINYV